MDYPYPVRMEPYSKVDAVRVFNSKCVLLHNQDCFLERDFVELIGNLVDVPYLFDQMEGDGHIFTSMWGLGDGNGRIVFRYCDYAGFMGIMSYINVYLVAMSDMRSPGALLLNNRIMEKQQAEEQVREEQKRKRAEARARRAAKKKAAEG